MGPAEGFPVVALRPVFGERRCAFILYARLDSRNVPWAPPDSFSGNDSQIGSCLIRANDRCAATPVRLEPALAARYGSTASNQMGVPPNLLLPVGCDGDAWLEVGNGYQPAFAFV